MKSQSNMESRNKVSSLSFCCFRLLIKSFAILCKQAFAESKEGILRYVSVEPAKIKDTSFLIILEGESKGLLAVGSVVPMYRTTITNTNF